MRTTITLLFVLLVVHAAPGQMREHDANPRTISVRGAGTVSVAPDMVRLGVQINSRGESATAAMTETSKRAAAVLSILKSFGVDEKGIQTSRVGVTPIYDYEKRVQPPPIVAYNGSNEFTVVFRGKQMDRVGEFLDRAVSAGAGFSALQFESSRQKEFERDALKLAATDGRARAEVIARELGASLGQVMKISESIAGQMPVGRGIMAEAMSSGAPVSSGELSISAQVDLVFELK